MRLDSRRGFALAVALFSMVVIGALIAGAFFASTQEYRIGRNSLTQERSLAAAEYGQNAVIDGWPTGWNTTLAMGDTIRRSYVLPDGSIADVTVTKLSALLFHVASEGRAGSGLVGDARRKVGATLRLDTPEINVLGALTSHGSTKIGGSSMINGNDSTIAGWDCPPTSSPKPGIAIDDTMKISLSGCKSLNCVSGSPKLAQDPLAADTSTYFKFGDMSWKELTAMADAGHTYAAGYDVKNVAPVDSGGVKCLRNVGSNWGDTRRGKPTPYPCESFFPIIYAKGDVTLSSQGSGQGMLLVDGDLSITGGFEFYGPVIVRGNLKTAGTGGHINGAVMAANVDLDQNSVLGNAVVSYSSCAILKAISGSALPMPVRDRAWMDLF